MQHSFAVVVGSLALGGCSLVYNPNNLPDPKVDAALPPDAAAMDAYVIDGNPDLLMLTAVTPATIYEGVGTGGARKAVLALDGLNFVGPFTIDFMLPAGLPMNPTLTADVAHISVTPDSTMIAVPVTVDVNELMDEGTPIPIGIRVTQMSTNGGMKSATLDNAFTVQMLDELKSAPTLTAAQLQSKLYAKIEIGAAVDFGQVVSAPPVALRAVSSASVTDLSANAAGQVAGTGGKPGGAANAVGGGGGGGGIGSTTEGGGGGGCSVMGGGANGGSMTGDGLISIYTGSGTDPKPSYGSGGGGSSTGKGGGGGGGIEVSAGGDVTVGTISVNGGKGTAVTSGGGGGSGGVVVLRAGGTLAMGALIDAQGGAGGGGLAAGNGGAQGRVRLDATAKTGSPTINALEHDGFAFDAATPLAMHNPPPPIVVHGTGGDVLDVYVFDKADPSAAPTNVKTGIAVQGATASVSPTLHRGYNYVCVTPTNSAPTRKESTTCIDVVLLP